MKKGKRKFIKRKKLAHLFDEKEIIISYKHPQVLSQFLTERGKILPRTITGITRQQQSVIVENVKRARYLALLPFSVTHYEGNK